MRRFWTVGIVCLLQGGLDIVPAQERGGKGTSLQIGTPFRIYPSGVTQTETFIIRHPTNPNIIFASANTINLSNGFVSEGVYVTQNAGQTWNGSDTCNGAPIAFHRGDPAITIDKNGTFILVRLGFSPGLYAHYSTNNGQTWSSQRTVATNDQDRAALTSDTDPASANYGRTYTAWVRFAIPYPVFYSFTDDGGATWSAPSQINSPPQRSQGAELSLGPNGRINVCWAGVISTSPYTEDYVGFATTTNGGANWTVTENAFDVNGIQGTLPQKGNIRVNGLPKIDTDRTAGPRNGWIYIVTTQRNLPPAGSDPDIIFNRSTNNGQTWSPGIRVNGDPPNNGRIQYFPAIHVDDFGGINVLYYDDRDTSPDSAGIYLSRSTDGGDTWTDYRVSNHHYKPAPIGGLGQGYQGDNIGMTSVGNTLWPVWMDNSSGLYQIWTCPIDIPSLSVEMTDRSTPEAFRLAQNYPNPFNPSTKIEFQLPSSGIAELKVFDVRGKEVATIVDRHLDAGTYTATFDASGLSSGVYFYRLSSGDGRQTRKMILMR